MVAVIVIVGILAAVAVPTMSTLDDSRAAAAGRQLLADVTFARQRAVATGNPSWVVFDTDAETWTVLVENPQKPGRDEAAPLADPVDGTDYVETLGVDRFINVELLTVNFDGGAEVGFDWLGRPFTQAQPVLNTDGTVTITGGYTLTVHGGSGHTTLATP